MNEPVFYDDIKYYWEDWKMNIKIRPAILLGELVLGAVAYFALVLGFETVAGAAVGGICATLPKLVESEEHGS